MVHRVIEDQAQRIRVPRINGFPDVVLCPGEVIDTGSVELTGFLRSSLEERLLWVDQPYRPCGVPQRLLPSPLLSDQVGTRLWDRINRLPTYYQTDGEIDLFRKRGLEIAKCIAPGTILVDLGCGNVRKIRPLLDILESLEKPVWYFALDLCRESLESGMQDIGAAFQHVKCFGLWADFDGGLQYLNTLAAGRPRLFLSLGSIFGNDHFHRAVARLLDWKTKALVNPEDMMLLTMDATTDPKTLWDSYHDAQGLFEQFIRNGYRHSNAVLGCTWYRDDDWDLLGELQDDPDVHIFRLRARNDVHCPALGFSMAKGEYIDCYEAFKYGPEMMRRQFAEAGLEERACWKAPTRELYQYLLAASSCGAPPMKGAWTNAATQA